MSVSSVEELDLLISLCALVVPAVPQSDLVSAFNHFLVVGVLTLLLTVRLHNAILALSAKIVGSNRWAKAIVPSNETEVYESRTKGTYDQ